MTIDQTNVVDSIGLGPEKEEVQLIITDHRAWAGRDREDMEHMYLLQEKINTYLRFIESGEIYTAYPQARGRASVIRIIAKYNMSEGAREFFNTVQKTLLAAGHRITFERLIAS